MDPAEYTRRRRQLMRMAGPDAILILPAAPERVRSSSCESPSSLTPMAPNSGSRPPKRGEAHCTSTRVP